MSPLKVSLLFLLLVLVAFSLLMLSSMPSQRGAAFPRGKARANNYRLLAVLSALALVLVALFGCRAPTEPGAVLPPCRPQTAPVTWTNARTGQVVLDSVAVRCR